MILGIGTDLIEISRVMNACRKQNFLKAIFTDGERNYAGDSAEKYAGMFAAKEAVSKCLGTGFLKFRPADIEIRHDKLGKPDVILHGNAAERFEALKGVHILISISDTKEHAIAFAVLEG